MKCKRCKVEYPVTFATSELCFECQLLDDFNKGEAIDDPEEFFELIPGWLEELTELRARIADLEK